MGFCFIMQLISTKPQIILFTTGFLHMYMRTIFELLL